MSAVHLSTLASAFVENCTTTAPHKCRSCEAGEKQALKLYWTQMCSSVCFFFTLNSQPEILELMFYVYRSGQGLKTETETTSTICAFVWYVSVLVCPWKFGLKLQTLNTTWSWPDSRFHLLQPKAKADATRAICRYALNSVMGACNAKVQLENMHHFLP